ncbi:hypothetical protein ACTQ49_10250 [Luteococcus sp. Sow4_B9]|uniref:hypothetical protein n=1 Tax=Luteococcus sp. Sow4_B9 TaxID=3438792 RepID=UPI003F9B3A8B
MPAHAAPADTKGSEKTGQAIARRVMSCANPNAAFQALDPAEKEAYGEASKIVSTETKVSAPRNTATGAPGDTTMAKALNNAGVGSTVPQWYSGCWAMQNSAAGKSIVGITLVKYGQTTSVCVGSGRVTSVSVYNVWHEIIAPGWDLANGFPTKNTFNAGREGRGRAQWKFQLNVAGYPLQNPSPCLQLRLNANGYNYKSSTSCNLS